LKPLIKNILHLILLELLILAAGWILSSGIISGIAFSDIIILSASFTILSLITIIIFFSGQKKDPAAQTMHILIALGLKFIIEMVIALLWFFVAKKTAPEALLLFFVLYLAFTLFSVAVVLKTLKYKPL